MTIGDSTKPWRYLILLACLGIAACSGKIPGVYRVPVQQGNVITVDMLQELKLGMDKRKVRFILGTPLVIDVFHLDRWDYFYSYNPGSGDTVQQRASLFFEADRLVRINADIDSDIDFRTVTQASEKVLIVPPKKKGGFLAAITPAFVKRDEEEQAQEKIAKELATGYNASLSASIPASADGEIGEVLEPAAAAPATIGPDIGDQTLPSEVYAPNTPAGFETAGVVAPAPDSRLETTSAQTRNRSRYLEQLFEDFGAEPQPAAAQTGTGRSAPDDFATRDPTIPVRD